MIDPSSWPTSAEKLQYGIYLGTWTNYSRGRILGATLTLESRYGLLLLSFTATFVGFVASRFWRIMTLMLHRIYSTPEPRDALHHQRQVVLRNSSSAVSTLWTALQLAWSWRTIADGYLARVLPTIIFAASAFCAFTIAAGFTSSISSAIGSDVLIDGSQCGIMFSSAGALAAVSALYPWVSQSMNNAANYAQQCYSINTTGNLDCTTFVKSRLPVNSVLNASCPFSGNLCRSNDSNLLLDSGLISTDEFGLNMPTSQRMFYREMLHCAPLNTAGFASDVSIDNNYYRRYSYGGFGNLDDSEFFNWTYQIDDLDAQYRIPQGDANIRINVRGFGLNARETLVVNGTVTTAYSDFEPIPQLFLPDADLLMVFLSPAGIFFLNKTDDPWYRGVVPIVESNFRYGKQELYGMNEAASPLGCAMRYQYCDHNKKCGDLASFSDAVISSALSLFHYDPSDIWDPLGSIHEKDATASRFTMFQATIQSAADIYSMLNSLGSSSLISSQHLMQGFMGPLPDNQWQLDVSHWFDIRMAALQAVFVNTARGPNDEALLPYTTTANDEHKRAMCNNQKIRSTRYISLSLFGLYFTYVTGIVIILASYVAEPLLAAFYARHKYKKYKYLEWAANSTLQLQRLAYQGLGSEKWTNYTDDIPKTRPGYFLADLARAYPEDDNDEVQEVKPTVHATSTNTVSVSETSANPGVSAQSQSAPSRPVSAISELVPQALSPQTVPSQAVSPISQRPER